MRLHDSGAAALLREHQSEAPATQLTGENLNGLSFLRDAVKAESQSTAGARRRIHDMQTF